MLRKGRASTWPVGIIVAFVVVLLTTGIGVSNLFIFGKATGQTSDGQHLTDIASEARGMCDAARSGSVAVSSGIDVTFNDLQELELGLDDDLVATFSDDDQQFDLGECDYKFEVDEDNDGNIESNTLDTSSSDAWHFSFSAPAEEEVLIEANPK